MFIKVIEGQSILNFIKELLNDDACKAYLADMKWSKGFTCPKYESTKVVNPKEYTTESGTKIAPGMKIKY